MSCLVLKLWMRTLNSPFIIFLGSHWRRLLCDTSPPLFAIFRHPSLAPKPPPLHAPHLPVTAIQWGSFSPLVALFALFVSPPSLHYINTRFVDNCPPRSEAKANPFTPPPPSPARCTCMFKSPHMNAPVFVNTHTSCACGAALHSPQSWCGCCGTCLHRWTTPILGFRLIWTESISPVSPSWAAGAENLRPGQKGCYLQQEGRNSFYRPSNALLLHALLQIAPYIF